MGANSVAVVGAGVAGLTAAIELAARGCAVTVIEKAGAPGGKMREVTAGGTRLDAGPTVFTMRDIFEEVFASAGERLSDHVSLQPAEILARHAWGPDERLDLYADMAQSADAIAAFAGPEEGRRYLAFCDRAKRIYETLNHTFIRAPQPNMPELVKRVGPGNLGGLFNIAPFATMWGELGKHFRDQRLRQLFGRYATYCGSSPFLAPATLMLIAHVEQAGVWMVDGGMHRLARALADLAERKGAHFRYGTEVTEVLVRNGRAGGVALSTGERIETDAVVFNGDAAALSTGRLGPSAVRAVPPVPYRNRSLSAVTWCLNTETEGFPLLRHTVFFCRDYAAEFDDIFRKGRLPARPTVYICAQDRPGRDGPAPSGPERLLCLVNAPPAGDTRPFDAAEIDTCQAETFALLKRCGLTVHRTETAVVTTPATFERLFPATGGALYGQATHGGTASFRRPGSKSRIPGLYLAGGSVHPGAGVPMAAMSGRLAAARLLADSASTRT